MERVYERCCGIDVHKKMVVACLILVVNGQRRKEARTFRTTTQELLLLLDWLSSAGCTHVAMESTATYWKPIYNLLEGHFELLVVNAQHIKAVPGRKTDVHDAEWIADLLQHGLLRASFIPPASQRDLRELTRYRTNLVEERVRAANRLQQTLEGTNLKLGDVATDILGKSGRAILEALLAGQTDPVILAELARGRMKAKRAELEQALVGTITAHHRFLLREQLDHIDTLNDAISRVSNEIEERMQSLDQVGQNARPPQQTSQEQELLTWNDAIELLDTIPGINQRAAEGILAEIGTDMTRFTNAHHLASWAGMCPGSNESAGKRLSSRIRKGSPWLRTLLVEAAHAAAHSKNTYLSAQYRRLAARCGTKKAAVAVGHTLLIIMYHVLQEREGYRELGGNYFDERDRQITEKRLVRRLEKLGYEVSVKAPSPAA